MAATSDTYEIQDGADLPTLGRNVAVCCVTQSQLLYSTRTCPLSLAGVFWRAAARWALDRYCGRLEQIALCRVMLLASLQKAAAFALIHPRICRRWGSYLV